MDNIRYLDGVQVRLLRTFVLQGTNYSEVMPINSDESTVVETARLKDNVEYIRERKLKKENVSHIVIHDTAVKHDGITEAEIVTWMFPDEVENETTGDGDNTPEDIVPIVFATNVKTDEIVELGDVSLLSSSEAVIKLDLDPEAIQRCLDGEQKTHKGFTFDLK